MNKIIVDKIMKSPEVRRLGLKEEAILDILDVYNSISLTELLDNGTINLGNGIVVDIVQLLDRVHMLRGVAYPNTRKYKLKLTLDDSLYEKIEAYYNKLKEDIS